MTKLPPSSFERSKPLKEFFDMFDGFCFKYYYYFLSKPKGFSFQVNCFLLRSFKKSKSRFSSYVFFWSLLQGRNCFTAPSGSSLLDLGVTIIELESLASVPLSRCYAWPTTSWATPVSPASCSPALSPACAISTGPGTASTSRVSTGE